ncbi:hemolysin family protein [Chitinophaga nivalis]|uniref:Hemolysin family protein n=1 Tax=Chitinophaga nivalis TaxID=2991709 RepID=A0ABT3IFN1_9BACT|nr:hemolysin family protein [Chitinophaga nivalis]MCW3467546.1 hemolysin family protein [Chitinophaga nivalis]MCW3482762.1 hemolysin family protein [Chitinophaga nivalis]
MEVVIIIILILLNGLFSMSEIAMVSARKIRLENQANKGDEKAKAALKLANKPDTFLSTVQIGITLIGILTGIYSGSGIKADVMAWLNTFPSLQQYSSILATILIVVVITFFSLVFGELLPKRIGMAKPESIAKYMAKPMTVLSWLTFPFILLLSAATNLLVKLLNIKSNDTHVTEEEIKAIINEGTSSGAIEETEQEIIERVFHLGDRNITSLMTYRNDITWLDINEAAADYHAKILDSLHSVYPVCDGQIDSIRGLVTIKDLYGVTGKNVKLSEIIKKPLFVPENNTAYQVLEKFKETHLHAAFIVDEYGTFLGMITLNDILEAIVGDMPETAESDDYEMVLREDGTWLVDAQIPFYDFLEEFDYEDWATEFEQDFDTLAGFVLHHLEHIPQTGEKFAWRGFTFEIVDMDAHRIDKVLVTPPAPTEET